MTRQSWSSEIDEHSHLTLGMYGNYVMTPSELELRDRRASLSRVMVESWHLAVLSTLVYHFADIKAGTVKKVECVYDKQVCYGAKWETLMGYFS